MKKIIYGLFALILSANTIGQTLMSDEDHRIMMNGFATNVNMVLTTELPVGMTLDQFKKTIVNGDFGIH